MSEQSSKPSSEALRAPKLDAAIAAARALAEQGADDGAATRLRLRETFSERSATKRKRRTLWLSGVIAALLGSTAFAHYAGWKLPGTTTTQVNTPPPAPVSPPTFTQQPAPPPPAPVSPPTITQQPAPPPPPAPVSPPTITQQPAPTPISPPTIVRVPAPRPTITHAPTPAPTIAQEPTPHTNIGVAEPTLPTQADAELQLYRSAHEIHFHQNNPAAALAAWDTYLAAFPDGRLAFEARYARAVALVKLERWQDAQTALRPFAIAPVGAYRQREAVQLLDAISKLSATPPR